MFVKADFRGSEYGVAKNLILHAEAWAQQKKATAIYLGTTERFAAAHKFYRKNGYIELEKNRLPIEFPVMFVDTLFFAKALIKR